MDYVGIVDPAEEKMDFSGYVRVQNNSGEEYADAQVRLIVGKINLVEKIAELARRQGIPMPKPSSPHMGRLRRDGAKQAFDQAARAQEAGMLDAAKAVVKEGISEYFMFTIDGTETLRNGWSKRMRSFRPNASKMEKIALCKLGHLEEGDPDELGVLMGELAGTYPHMDVWGGCCGTGDLHLRQIARAVKAARGLTP